MISSRRQFTKMSLAAATALAGWRTASAAAEAPPETRAVRFSNYPAICVAPQWLAEEMLRGEGFADVQYADVPDDSSSGAFLAAGKCDFSIEAAPVVPAHVDAGVPMVALAGIHSGCFELFAHHALRLHEAGLITSSPQRVIAQGSDWRFLVELKKELRS